MIKEATAALIDGKDLTYEQANAVINEIMNGDDFIRYRQPHF